MRKEENFIDEIEIVIKELEKTRVTTTRAVEAMAKIRGLYHDMAGTPKRYEVRTWSLCDGWKVNSWMITDDNGNEVPQTFGSIEAAQQEIDADLDDPAFESDGEDYRIFDTKTGEFVG